MSEDQLKVVVTGPTGTFGSGLLPLLDLEPRVAEVVGLARRPFDPQAAGYAKLTYVQGDVRDPDALAKAFAGADVVVHLAFLIAGAAPRAQLHAVNVEGTTNVARAAADAGVKRLVYASSVAAYGFHADTPVPIPEDWPTRPADHLFYAQDKAQLDEQLRTDPALADVDVYLLRPSVVAGPDLLGAKAVLPGPLEGLAGVIGKAVGNVRLPIPVPVPKLPLQLVHADDIGTALLACILGDGPAGPYNIAGDGTVTLADFVRAMGLLPLEVLPGSLVEPAARAIAALPGPAALGWAEFAAKELIMDTTRAKAELGWQPRYTAAETLAATFAKGPRPTQG